MSILRTTSTPRLLTSHALPESEYKTYLKGIIARISNCIEESLPSFKIDISQYKFDSEIVVKVLRREYLEYEVTIRDKDITFESLKQYRKYEPFVVEKKIDFAATKWNLTVCDDQNLDGYYLNKIHEIIYLINEILKKQISDSIILNVDKYDVEFLVDLLHQSISEVKGLSFELVKIKRSDDTPGSFLKISDLASSAKVKMTNISNKCSHLEKCTQKIKVQTIDWIVSSLIENSKRDNPARYLYDFFNSRNAEIFTYLIDSPEKFQQIINVLTYVKTCLIEDMFCAKRDKDAYLQQIKVLNFLDHSKSCNDFAKNLGQCSEEFKKIIFGIYGLNPPQSEKSSPEFPSTLRRILFLESKTYFVMRDKPNENYAYASVSHKIPQQLGRFVVEASSIAGISINGKKFTCQFEANENWNVKLSKFFKSVSHALCKAGWDPRITEDEIANQADAISQMAVLTEQGHYDSNLDGAKQASNQLLMLDSSLTGVLRFATLNAFGEITLWFNSQFPEIWGGTEDSEFKIMPSDPSITKPLESEIFIKDRNNFVVTLTKEVVFGSPKRINNNYDQYVKMKWILNFIMENGILTIERKYGDFEWMTKDIKIQTRFAQILMEKSLKQVQGITWEFDGKMISNLL